MKGLLIFSLLVAVALCSSSQSTWNALTVKYGYPEVDPYAFNPMPRVLKNSTDEWKLVDDGCADPSLNYNGKRYMKDSDYGLMLIMDINGIVAGIQMAIPKEKAEKVKDDFVDYTAIPASIPHYLGGQNYYVFTAYFVDPAFICTRGRTEKQLEQEGTGTGLYFQKGRFPLTNSVKQPMDLEKGKSSLDTQGITRQRCTPKMGRHYFKGVDDDENCKCIGPYFLMSDDSDNQVAAFGFMTVGIYESNRFEHPPMEALTAFLNRVPTCAKDVFSKAGGLTAMHVYLRWPAVDKCST